MLLLSLAFIGLVGWMDNLTGTEVSLSPFFVIPIAACAWNAGLFAGAIFERIRALFQERMAAIEYPVSLSVGLFTFNKPPSSVEEMISKADDALFACWQCLPCTLVSARYAPG